MNSGISSSGGVTEPVADFLDRLTLWLSVVLLCAAWGAFVWLILNLDLITR
jgi:hypothetical protein